jgi:hypothetical protein
MTLDPVGTPRPSSLVEDHSNNMPFSEGDQTSTNKQNSVVNGGAENFGKSGLHVSIGADYLVLTYESKDCAWRSLNGVDDTFD